MIQSKKKTRVVKQSTVLLLGVVACMLSASCPPNVGQLGCSSGVARGDFNGDGFSDLAIGVPGKAMVVVIYGSAFGLTAGGDVKLNIPASQQLPVERFDPALAPFRDPNYDPGYNFIPLSELRFGSSLASGDFNGDGHSDLAIGWLRNIYDGIVCVIYGSKAGFAPNAKRQRFNNPNGEGSEFGRALAWGDFNGDGYGDLAIGDPFARGSVYDPTASNELRYGRVGKVTIRYGTATGLGNNFESNPSNPQNKQEFQPFYPYRIFENTQEEYIAEDGEEFGAALSAGDFNGDGRTDLAVSAPKKDVRNGTTGTVTTDSGAVFVYFALPNARYLAFKQYTALLSEEVPDKIYGIGPARTGFNGLIGIPRGNEQVGVSLASGDFDGNGIHDLAIGSPFESVSSSGTRFNSAGVVRVLYDINGFNTQQVLFQNTITGLGSSEADDTFGAALAAGDFNGDGRHDLAIGVPNEDIQTASGSTLRDAGEVDVIYGSSSGLSTTVRAPQRWVQGSGLLGASSGLDRFGSSLTAWNFGQNEFRVVNNIIIPVITADLAIGVPGEDVTLPNRTKASDAGCVNVIYGNKEQGNGLRTSSNQLWTLQSPGIPGDAASGDRLGEALY